MTNRAGCSFFSLFFIKISIIRTSVFHFPLLKLRRGPEECREFALVNVEQQPILDGFRNKIPSGKGLRIIFSQRLHLPGNAAQANQTRRQIREELGESETNPVLDKQSNLKKPNDLQANFKLPKNSSCIVPSAWAVPSSIIGISAGLGQFSALVGSEKNLSQQGEFQMRISV